MICFLPSLRGSLRPICFSSRGLSAAFTVVELLVVVVVVVGLMALLAPTVMESMKKSRDAGCVSNLKAIGVAVQLYLNDNNGKFPIDGYHTANDRNFVFPYLGLPKSVLDVWKKEGGQRLLLSECSGGA